MKHYFLFEYVDMINTTHIQTLIKISTLLGQQILGLKKKTITNKKQRLVGEHKSEPQSSLYEEVCGPLRSLIPNGLLASWQ